MVQMTNFVASTVPIKRFFGGKTKTATPKNTNRPGYSSKPASSPTGTNRPGFSAPRPSFLSGLGSDNSELPAKRRATRDRFFDGDTSISKDRLDRRYTQFAELEKFKQGLKDEGRVVKGLKQIDPVTGKPTDVFMGSTPVFDTNTASPTFGQYVSKTVADKANELAFKYGPTPSEVLSDMGKGLGSMFGGLMEKGPPVMQMAKGLFEKFKNQLPQAGTPSFFNPNDIIGLVNALPDAQKRIYYDLLGSGVPYQKAYEQASGLPFTKFQQNMLGGIGDDTIPAEYVNYPNSISVLALRGGQNFPKGGNPGGFLLENMAMGGVASLQ